MNSHSSSVASRRTLGWLTALTVGAFGLGPGHVLSASAPRQVAKAQQSLAVAPAFTLEVRRTAEETKGDIHIPAEWVTQLAIPGREILRFRFRPNKQVAAATMEWRVYAGPPPIADFQGTAANLRSRGSAGPVPAGEKLQEFDIDFRDLLPAKPDNTTYFVRLVGRDAEGKYTAAASSAIPLKYETSSWGTRLPDVPIVASVSQQSRTLTVVLKSSLESTTALGEIPPDVRIVLEPQKVTPAPWWWGPANAPVLRLKPSSIGNTAGYWGSTGTGKRLEVSLPAVIGGDYRLRVESSAIGYPTKWAAAKLAWRLPQPLYSIQYQGVRCVEETDGPGADELAVYVSGGLNTISALPFEEFDQNWPRQLIARHDDVDEDETHPAAVTLVERKALEFVTPAAPLRLFFDLLEIDGPITKKGKVVSASDFQIIARQAALSITAKDLRNVARTQGWHTWTVNVKGHDLTGGRYRLRFGLKADPATN